MPWDCESAYEALRTHAGMFVLAEKSLLYFHAENACQTLEKLLCCDVRAQEENSCGYGLMLNPQGGILQDALILRLLGNQFCTMVNTGRVRRILMHLQRCLPEADAPETLQEQVKLFAVLGPASVCALGLSLAAGRLQRDARIGGVECLACRSSGRGMQGVLLAVRTQDAGRLTEAIRKLGVPLCPGELLDTLMLEEGTPVYGREMDDTINPYEVGLERFVRKVRPTYIGRDALVAAGEPRRGLIGLKLCGEEAGHGMPVVKRDKEVGVVTSVAYSPRLGCHAAMALVEKPYRDAGRKLYVETPDGLLEARVTGLPLEAGETDAFGEIPEES